MSYNNYKDLILKNMPKNQEPGLWQGKGEPRSHILGNPQNQKEKAVLINDHSLLHGVEHIDPTEIHLHQYAHHLNSSQIMCYNFFRPLMDNMNKDNNAKKPLVQIIEILTGKELSKNVSSCRFEHIDKSGESTNFDFYFESGDVKVYFEIKYTENFFSKKCSAANPQQQFNHVYKPMIDIVRDIIFKKDVCQKDFLEQYYQLFRNSLRATDENKFVFFVCPNAHKTLRKQFGRFADDYLNQIGKQRVRLITWEELVDIAKKQKGVNTNQFEERYLNFLA